MSLKCWNAFSRQCVQPETVKDASLVKCTGGSKAEVGVGQVHQCEITNLTSNRAIEIACDVRLHRSFILPANRSSGRDRPIRITYSDAGRDPEPADGLHLPVVLWAGGMFGGRYQAYLWDEIAQDYGVRIIAVDRPGIGGTGAVPLEHRMATWLDIVPDITRTTSSKSHSRRGHTRQTHVIEQVTPLPLGTRFPGPKHEAIPTFQRGNTIIASERPSVAPGVKSRIPHRGAFSLPSL